MQLSHHRHPHGIGGARMIDSAKIMEVIRVQYATGCGTEEDPVRTEVLYLTTNGDEIAKMNINDDPYSPFRQ